MATPREVVSQILHLRQHYHFGPGKIADYLRRFHQQSLAVSSVHRILLRHGMNRLPTNQKHRAHARRWQRYEKAQPGFRLQLDVKFLERIPGTQNKAPRFVSSMTSCAAFRSGSASFKPTTVRSFRPGVTGIWSRAVSSTPTSGLGRPT
jgi:hypothetical protein